MRHLRIDGSENIDSVAFELSKDPSDYFKGTMEVVFKSSLDVVYRYEVGVEQFLAFVNADSIGKAFHTMFRLTKYPFTKSARTPTLKK